MLIIDNLGEEYIEILGNILTTFVNLKLLGNKEVKRKESLQE